MPLSGKVPTQSTTLLPSQAAMVYDRKEKTHSRTTSFQKATHGSRPNKTSPALNGKTIHHLQERLKGQSADASAQARTDQLELRCQTGTSTTRRKWRSYQWGKLRQNNRVEAVDISTTILYKKSLSLLEEKNNNAGSLSWKHARLRIRRVC